MEYEQIYQEIDKRCLRCGTCVPVCDILPALGVRLPGDIAAELINGEVDQRLEWFIPRCSLCGLCKFECPQGIDLPSLVLKARSELIEQGRISTERYRAMAVDQEHNSISLFRKTYGIDVSDLELESCKTAFLPSCTLLNVAPNVARAAHAWLADALGEEVGIVTECCGMPLQEMGLFERYERYQDAFWKKLHGMGVGRLIVACPNCLGWLAHRGSHQEGIKTQSLYELMATMGLRAPILKNQSVTIHDSCPTRGTEMSRWVREILSDNVIVETQFHGDCSRCCGSGGAVGMYDYVLSGIRAKRRVEELVSTGADVIVTSCMSSCSTMTLPEADGKVRHLLELVFGLPVDHEGYAARVADMWTGEAGEINNALMATDLLHLPV